MDTHTESDRTLALALIAMAAKENTQIVKSNVNVLMDFALQNQGSVQDGYHGLNLPLATQALNALQTLVESEDVSVITLLSIHTHVSQYVI